ncbi:MAG: alpha/beta hydrolase family protein [Syntrophobacteraceae bacterium]
MPHLSRIDLPVEKAIIACVIHVPDQVPAPVVVCCHGLLSHKDSTKFAAIGERFCDEGLGVVRFDFSGCGGSTRRAGPLLEARLTDLCGVLSFVREQPWADGRIGLLGSSMGGYLALLLSELKTHPVQAAVCWATPFSLHGVRASVAGSEAIQRRLGGFEGFGKPMDLSDLSPASNVMVVHGQQDETVPWGDAIRVYDRLAEPKRLLLLENGNHRLTGPMDRKVALDASLDWLRETHLLPSSSTGR